MSKPYIDRSPNTTYGSIPVDRYFEGRQSLKQQKLMARCPNCHKLIFKKYLKLHVCGCQYVSYGNESYAQEIESGKCQNCAHCLVANAKFCMMCGMKIEEISE